MKRLLYRFSFLLLIGLPVASLAINAVAWLRYGIDLPYFDDWWSYFRGQKGSFDRNNLWQPISYTLSPVGYALDALAQRYLDGNSVAYQFLSMVVVLGGLLLLQWRLLLRALGDARLAAVCFVFTLLMLQPGSYWGRENLAYHQVLPLLFILSALSLLFSPAARDFWRIPIVCALGLLAGFSYVSGAFAVLAAGLSLLGVCVFSAPSAQRTVLLRGGGALSLAGIATSGVQLLIAVLPYAGPTASFAFPFAFPYQSDFWLFVLGKLGRSLLLPPIHPVGSMVAVLLVCTVAVMVYAVSLRHMALRRTMDVATFRVGTVYVVLAAVIAVYLAVVAGGRANLRPPEVQSATQVFAYGFLRFHFFWATLLWPWLVAGCLVLLRSRGAGRSPVVVVVSGVALVFATLFMIDQGALRHKEAHMADAAYRRSMIVCLMNQVQRGEGIRCPGLIPTWDGISAPDLTSAFLYGRDTGASFVRYFPILPLPIGLDDPAPWFRLSRDRTRSEMHNIEATLKAGMKASMPLRAGSGAQLLIQVGRPKEMAGCRLLDLNLLLRTEQSDLAQVFYRPLGVPAFDESLSKRVSVSAPSESPQTLSFQFESVSGFEDQLRLDPVTIPQGINISEIEVRCRLRGKVGQSE